MIDYDLVKLMHRHGDSWASLEPLDRRAPTDDVSSAALDPERSPERWTRIYRCASCAEEFAVGTGDPPASEGGSAG